MLTRTHNNCMVVGESGTGKTVLSSILTNPLKEKGYYFLDPDFRGANVRLNEEYGVSFIDTKPLSKNFQFTAEFVRSVVADLSGMHVSLTGWIFCVRYGRVKSDCIWQLQLIKSMAAIAGCRMSVFVSNCVDRPAYMIDVFREKCGIAEEDIFWLRAEVAEPFDDFLGRWIQGSDEINSVRQLLLRKYGI